MCSCDCERPQAWAETRRKARHTHLCCECGNAIVKGDTYKYVSGIWDNRPGSYKTCWPCVAARNRDRRENAGWRDWCEPCLGQLYDDWPREALPKHLLAQVRS